MPDLLTILFIGLPALGLWLLAVGWRGRRIDNHPWCRRCRFDLVGSWPGSARCPECGADLARARAVRIGQRRRRHFTLGAGAAMLLMAAGLAGLTIYQRTSPINWNAYKPDAWLVRELKSTKPERAEAALAQLVLRDRSQSLSSKNRTAVLDHIYARYIPQLKATKVNWIPVVERAWLDGTLSTDGTMEYARRTFGMSLSLPQAQIVRKGDVLTFSISLRPPYGHRSEMMDFEVQPIEARLGDFTYQLNPKTIRISMVSDLNTGDGPLPWYIPVEVGPGQSILHVAWRVNCVIAREPQTSVTWEDSLDLPIDVLPPGPESVTFFADEETAKQMRDAIHFDVVGLRRISEEDDRAVIVGSYAVNRLDAHASVNLDLTDNNGVVEGTNIPQGVSWGFRHTFYVLVPRGQENESLEFTLYPCQEYGRWWRDGYEPPSDKRPLWFGAPITIRVPVRWVDSPESDGVSDEIRRKVEGNAHWWRRDDER